jgi:CubicO group peptidase (beta-lactamase class C family)
MNKIFILIFLTIFYQICNSQSKYFPPIIGNNWETTGLYELGWDSTKVQPLYEFLENENSKAFIVLKDGKIVIEKYFGTFNKDSSWYWASAGKTITSFLIGKAQEDGILRTLDLTSKYLGNGWTKCTKEKEDKITIWNQITMTSGLDDGVADNHCLKDSCLTYKADAGTRWAYHNAPYTLLEKVLENATGQNINTYTQQKLKSQTGISGFWFTLDYDNVFFSKARSFARFGLLYQNDCVWNNDTLLKDKDYIFKSSNTSQNLNLSYGYLWWLNGKSTFMVPSLQNVFNGPLFQDAPSDVFAGLGKNGQIVCISKSKGLVVVRMGEQPGNFGDVPTVFCNQIWEKLNAVMNIKSDVNEIEEDKFNIAPNPSNTKLHFPNFAGNIIICDLLGNQLIKDKVSNNAEIDISNLKIGIYIVKLENSITNKTLKFVKN